VTPNAANRTISPGGSVTLCYVNDRWRITSIMGEV
jgi:hypothetical protein